MPESSTTQKAVAVPTSPSSNLAVTSPGHAALRAATGTYFGSFVGRFVPEALVAALDELEAAFAAANADPAFGAELDHMHRTFAGRPSILTEAPRFAQHAGGARILLKREDLNHTGSHKINN